MTKEINRPDPMIAGGDEPPRRIHISVLTYESPRDLEYLPSNVTVGLAVPVELPIDEWSRKAKIEIAKAQNDPTTNRTCDDSERRSGSSKNDRD